MSLPSVLRTCLFPVGLVTVFVLIGPGSALSVQKKSAAKAAPGSAPASAKRTAPKANASSGFTPISLDPVNPHYLRFRGRPTVFLTSGEHYGAVLNAGFDYVKYLDALRENNLNLTRVFNGAYLESLDTTVYRGGDQNTLAPTSENYLAPWPRVNGKFDLSTWDERYFERLRNFVAEAGKRNIAVEVTLFSVQYGSGTGTWGSWNLNPLNAANNNNKVGAVAWDRFNTMTEPALVAAQDALVVRTVRELNGFDNVYFEICNEPYFSGAIAKETAAWSNHLVGVVKQAESKLPNQHLIAQNFANGYAEVKDANPAISILNFHYASPPAAVPLNWAWKRPIAFDETANGCNALDRRREAWAFILAGGAVYNNLDPSFATGDATGTGQVKAADQAFNCSEIRYQLGILQTFLRRFEIQYLQPDRDSIRQWPLGASEAYLLSEPARNYALYLKASGTKVKKSMLVLDLPIGHYQVEWLNPRTGDNDKGETLDHKGGMARVLTPDYTEDLAMRMIKLVEGTAGDAPRVPASTKPAVRPRR